jgi:hypothetical protein
LPSVTTASRPPATVLFEARVRAALLPSFTTSGTRPSTGLEIGTYAICQRSRSISPGCEFGRSERFHSSCGNPVQVACPLNQACTAPIVRGRFA